MPLWWRSVSLISLFVLLPLFAHGGQPCVPKSYGEDRVVCVCNSTYCDDLDSVILQPKGGFSVYTSSLAGQRFKLGAGVFQPPRPVSLKLFPKNPIPNNSGASVAASPPAEDAKPEVKITVSRVQRQTIVGYGGAFTDAAGINIADLPQAAQEKLISSYYGPNGIGYTVGRVPMGGCDFSPRPYTYADSPLDLNLTQFQLQEEDYKYKIPYIRLAQSMSANKLRLYGSPWTAPPWMKTNNDYIGMGSLRTEYYQTWANYFVKFLESYQKEGLDFWGVTTQNEPFDGLVPFFPFNCMGWRASQQRDWIKNNLGPTIKKSRFPDTKIIILDENTAALPRWPQKVLADKEAAEYVWGIGIHWYSTEITKYEPIMRTHKLLPDYAIFATEACAGFLPWEREKVIMGSWERGEAYAEDILQGLNNYVVGWTDWNLALNPAGGPNWANLAADSAIIVNKTAGEFYKQPMYYALGHIAKFLLPDSRVLSVETTSLTPDEQKSGKFVNAAVQRPDGSIALVLLNKNEHDVRVVLSDQERGNSYLVVPKRSMQTLVYA